MSRIRVVSVTLVTAITLLCARDGSAQGTTATTGGAAAPGAADRLGELAKSIGGPLALISITGGAAVSHVLDSPREWHGRAGFGQRLASGVGQTVAAETTSWLLAELAHENTAFHVSRRHGVLARIVDAAAATVTAERPNGRRRASVARVGGLLASGTSRLLWYPARYRARDGLVMAASSAASGALVNLVREFVVRR